MPELTNFKASDYHEACEQIVARAKSELAEVAEKAREDLGVLERASSLMETTGFIAAHSEIERLWVAEFAVEGHALEARRGTCVNLAIPNFAVHAQARYVKLAEFAHQKQILRTGKYRAIVSIIRLDDGS